MLVDKLWVGGIGLLHLGERLVEGPCGRSVALDGLLAGQHEIDHVGIVEVGLSLLARLGHRLLEHPVGLGVVSLAQGEHGHGVVAIGEMRKLADKLADGGGMVGGLLGIGEKQGHHGLALALGQGNAETGAAHHGVVLGESRHHEVARIGGVRGTLLLTRLGEEADQLALEIDDGCAIEFLGGSADVELIIVVGGVEVVGDLHFALDGSAQLLGRHYPDFFAGSGLAQGKGLHLGGGDAKLRQVVNIVGSQKRLESTGRPAIVLHVYGVGALEGFPGRNGHAIGSNEDGGDHASLRAIGGVGGEGQRAVDYILYSCWLRHGHGGPEQEAADQTILSHQFLFFLFLISYLRISPLRKEDRDCGSIIFYAIYLYYGTREHIFLARH